MELSIVEEDILKFLSDYRIARKIDLVSFTGNSKGLIRRRLIALENKQLIQKTEEQTYYLKDDEFSLNERKNMLKVFDMIHYLKKKGLIKGEIHSTNSPFYVATKIGEKIVLFTTITPGNEKIEAKLIDLENKGDVILVLENKEQLEKIAMTTKVIRVFYLDEIEK